MQNTMAVELNEGELALVETYRTLIKLLRERDEDLAPYQRRNALKAVAALWQVMNGLDLDPEQIYDIGA
ncbi:MAG: hypothetical protein E6H92_13935 [Chloroflexi bacterium]|nr:MAG: hypothetical protein E6H92_13935 [Chloroflexota bacterium]